MKNRDMLWSLAVAGAAMAAAFAARQTLKQSWKAVAGTEPPENPAARDVAWSEALAWTFASATIAGAARLVAKRGAASVWKRAFGTMPPA